MVTWSTSPATVATIGADGTVTVAADGHDDGDRRAGLGDGHHAAHRDRGDAVVDPRCRRRIRRSPKAPPVKITATGTYSDGSTVDQSSQVTWSSDATSVATVAGGLVTGAGVGSANIGASMGGKASASTKVTVTAATLQSDRGHADRRQHRGRHHARLHGDGDPTPTPARRT